MRFDRNPEQFVVQLTQQDMGNLRRDGIIGVRDGVSGAESKVTVRSPRRGEYQRLKRALADVALDPGQDIYVIIDPYDQPRNGFVLEVRKDQLIGLSASPERTVELFPDAGLRVEVEAFDSNAPSIWHTVIDAATNDTEIVHEKAHWHIEG